MANAIEIRQRLLEWLDGSISLRQFEDWFVPATWNAHRENDPDAESLADEIEMNLSEYSGGQQNLEQLRGALRELANTVRPFALPAEATVANTGTAIVLLFPAGYPPSQMLSAAAGNNNAPIEIPQSTYEQRAMRPFLLERMPADRAEVGNALADTDSAIKGLPLRAVPA